MNKFSLVSPLSLLPPLAFLRSFSFSFIIIIYTDLLELPSKLRLLTAAPSIRLGLPRERERHREMPRSDPGLLACRRVMPILPAATVGHWDMHRLGSDCSVQVIANKSCTRCAWKLCSNWLCNGNWLQFGSSSRLFPSSLLSYCCPSPYWVIAVNGYLFICKQRSLLQLLLPLLGHRCSPSLGIL